MKYIDITPTWREILPLLVEIAVNAETPKARDTAWKELRRMADIADQAVAKKLSTDEMFADSER